MDAEGEKCRRAKSEGKRDLACLHVHQRMEEACLVGRVTSDCIFDRMNFEKA